MTALWISRHVYVKTAYSFYYQGFENLPRMEQLLVKKNGLVSILKLVDYKINKINRIYINNFFLTKYNTPD